MSGRPSASGHRSKDVRPRRAPDAQTGARNDDEQHREISDGKKGGARRGFAGKLNSAEAHAPDGADDELVTTVARRAFLDDRGVIEIWEEVADGRQ